MAVEVLGQFQQFSPVSSHSPASVTEQPVMAAEASQSEDGDEPGDQWEGRRGSRRNMTRETWSQFSSHQTLEAPDSYFIKTYTTSPRETDWPLLS